MWWVGNGQHNEDGLNNRPAEVKHSTEHTHNDHTSTREKGCEPTRSWTVRFCGLKFDSTNTNIAWNSSITLGIFVITVFGTLFLLALLKDRVFKLFLSFGITFVHDLFFALKVAFFILSTCVPKITFVVCLSALAWHTIDQLLVLFTVVAPSVLLPARVSSRLTEEAFVWAMAAIIGTPFFKIRIVFVHRPPVTNFTFTHVQWRKV